MSWNCILERVSNTKSTNDDLLARWRTGDLIDPVARIASEQTAGKGRAGRVWLARPDDTLCFSLAYPFQNRPNELSGLSLVIGLAVISGIAAALQVNEAQLYKQGLRLKWPNDLLLNGAKLGGILIEGGQTNANAPTWMIIGVGLNLKNADLISASLRDFSALEAASLEQLISAEIPLPDTDFIWLKLIESFEQYLTEFNRYGFSHFQNAWSEWDAFHACSVVVTGAGMAPIEGIATGVDKDGALLLQHLSQVIPIHAGDVSLRVQS